MLVWRAEGCGGVCARQLRSLIHGMEEGSREITKKAESIEDRDNDRVGVENDKSRLKDEEVLIVAELT